MSYQPSKRNSPTSMPCPNCRRLISTRSGKCIHCGYRLPGITASVPFMETLLNERVSFVTGIIVACGFLYAMAIAMDPRAALQFKGMYDLFAPSNEALYKLGAGGLIPLTLGSWWTVLTANYLHADLLHILFNMLWLRQLGPLTENLYGSSRFIVIYTIAGVFGSMVSAFIGKTPLFVGASGAVFGLFGALIYYGLRRGGTFGSAIFRQMLLWAGISLVLGFTGSGVDNWGHLGGIVGGAVAAFILGYKEQRRQLLAHHIAALVTLVFIATCFVMVVYNFFWGSSIF